MFAGKQFDIVMGTDIHLIQPPGPVPPVPIPHPFIGIVFDPPEFIPKIGTILVNGLPRAQAGSNVKCTLPHIPIGGTFVKPPGNDGEIYMGELSVKAETEPFTHFGAPVLTCQDVGMSSVSREERHSKSKPKSMLRPTSVLLPVPKGFPVLIAIWAFNAIRVAQIASRVAPVVAAGTKVAPTIVRGAAVPIAERGGAAIVAPQAARVAAQAVQTGLVVKSPKEPDDDDECKDFPEIEIPNENQIPQDMLDPPTKPGNAPTFKTDGTSVEIHHVGQKSRGPFKEMHWEDHRGRDNHAKNHPNQEKGSGKKCEKEFNKAKRKYWKNKYFGK